MFDERVVLSLDAMATRFEVVTFGNDTGRLRAAVEEAFDEVRRIEEQLSIYRRESELSCINAKAALESVKVDARLFRLLQHAKELSLETQGAFDMTVTPLLRAWGFTGDTGQVPDDIKLESVRRLVGMEHVLLDETNFTVHFDIEGVELDPGAIGKGYAVERAADILRETGITSALIHGGTSTVCAIGSPPDKSGWSIAIRNPIQEEEFLSIISLCDSSLSVSAVHGKSFASGNKDYGHVIDPRTGAPTEAAVCAAVIGPSPTDCDALSTALLVAGESWLPAFSDHRPDYRGLVATWDKENKSVKVAHTIPSSPII